MILTMVLEMVIDVECCLCSNKTAFQLPLLQFNPALKCYLNQLTEDGRW